MKRPFVVTNQNNEVQDQIVPKAMKIEQQELQKNDDVKPSPKQKVIDQK